MGNRLQIALFWIVVLMGMGLIFLLTVRPDLAPAWTGFEETGTRVLIDQAKTVWDWLQLLCLPVFILIGAWWLGSRLEGIGKRTVNERNMVEKEVAADSRYEGVLAAYFDTMTDLLMRGGLPTASKESTVRRIAHARTYAVLRRLDGKRKGDVVQFLYDAGLLHKPATISLRHADLAAARLERANLRDATFWLANLSGADLRSANLTGCDLWLADLRGANLRGANLSGAHLGGADLSHADLTNASLQKANLRKAKLAHANMDGALVTPEQLRRAASV